MTVAPLSRLETLILSVLAEKELFGREILHAVHKSTGDPGSLVLGSLYVTLTRMEEKGLIREGPGDATGPRPHLRRKYFRPTPVGMRALARTRSMFGSLWTQPGLAKTPKPPEARISRESRPRSASGTRQSVDRLNALAQVIDRKLDTLTEEFDALLTRMQTPRARAAMKAAFEASPKRLGKAAVTDARKRG